MSKETITFTFPGVMKVGFGNRSLIIDQQYTTDNENEIIRLRELNFSEKQLVEKEVEVEPKGTEVDLTEGEDLGEQDEPAKVVKATATIKPIKKKAKKKANND